MNNNERENDRKHPREIGIKLGTGKPGPQNSITDVPKVQVGHCTLIEGKGRLKPGEGPIRTGVTAVLPHDKNLYLNKARAATKIINGFGKTLGIPQIDELGEIETPIMLTNTLNVWKVADALTEIMIESTEEEITSLNPVVGECNDSYLNDIQGRHIEKKHVRKALEKSESKFVKEGTVGAGTGTSAFGLKGGIGTSSRVISCAENERDYTIGVLVVSNFGKLRHLRIKGIPIGRHLKKRHPQPENIQKGGGSIMIILGTDAPLSNRRLDRVLNRVPHGLARTGSISGHGSGDFAIGFSVASNKLSADDAEPILEEDMNKFFRATIESVEEAIICSLFKATTLVGRDGNKSIQLPINKTLEFLKERNVV